MTQRVWRYYAPYEPQEVPQKRWKPSKKPEPLDFTLCDEYRGARDVYAPDKWSKAFRAELVKLPITITALAKKAGVHRENAYSWRNGDSRPSEKSWSKFKAAMIEAYEEIYGG